MGYEDENFEPMVIDAETAARDGIDELLDVPEAPANYKDPQKILDARLDKLKTLIERAALEPYLNRFVAIGVWTPSRGLVVETAKDLAEERLLLASLAVLISNNGHRRRIVGFNSLSFDLPHLIMRASMQELQFPLTLSDIVPKWRHAANDLMEVMTCQGLFAKRSLDFYCRCYSIDSDESDEVKAIHGSDIPQLVKDGQWDLIAGHCRHDVVRTMKLAKRRGVIS
jgi:Predicted 3'-5' exonuclease related to the exonuclease domain of PolB